MCESFSSASRAASAGTASFEPIAANWRQASTFSLSVASDFSTAISFASCSGVAEGTVFYHFESKEKLFLAVLEHMRHEFERDFVEYFERVDVNTGLTMVDEAARFYLELAAEKEELFQLLHRSDAFELAMVKMTAKCEDLEKRDSSNVYKFGAIHEKVGVMQEALKELSVALEKISEAAVK